MANTRRAGLDAWLVEADAVLAGSRDISDDLLGVEDSDWQRLGKIWARLPKERDLDLHIRVGWIFGTEFVALADYRPSTSTYTGEIMMIQCSHLGRVVTELTHLTCYLGSQE